MANVQAALSWGHSADLVVPGINLVAWDVQFGSGGGFLGPIVFNQETWLRIQKTSLNSVFGNYYFNHNYLHWFMDPANTGPDIVIRMEDLVIIDWLASTTARFFYGFGIFPTVTDPTSLRGIGFYVDSNGNWIACAIDATGDLARFDTGVLADDAPHQIRTELNALLKTITWFIDNVQVHTITLTTSLDQIDDGVGASTGLRLVQALQSNTEAFNVYYAGGWQTQLSFITSDDVVVLPVISARLTYQRILNMARLRAPEFGALVIDDQMVMDELNHLTLDLIQEGSDADHAVFQELLLWSTDVLPGLPTTPTITDLRDTDRIVLPTWVNSVYAIQGVRLNAKKIEIAIRRKETDIRDRGIEGETFLVELRDPRIRKPVAFRVWNPTESRWEFVKDEVGVAPGTNPWDAIIDVEIIVSGVRIAMTVRANLTTAIPVPFQAMRALIEAYALILGGRAGKDNQWMREQRLVKEAEWLRFREWVQTTDMSTDEAFDPEIGLP